jgi:Zn-finger nucleic acid-binding protein
MQSPVDPSVEMRKINKLGVEIEYCPKSGGVWLDKGELEKLIEIVEDRASAKYSHSDNMAPQIDEDHIRRNREYDYDDDRQSDRHPRRRKRESVLGEIFDIF